MTDLHKLILVMLCALLSYSLQAHTTTDNSLSSIYSCPTDSLQITLQSPVLCSRSPIEFQTNLLTTDLSWNYGDGTINDGGTEGHSSHIYLESGNYQVQVTANYGNDCVETATIDLEVVTNETDFTYQVNNNTVTFTAIPSAYSAIERYSWSLGDGALASGLTTHLEYTYRNTGEYLVTLLGEGPCATAPTVKTIVVGTPPSPEDTPTACNDGIDNDGDGTIDCADLECECICTSGAFGCCDDFTVATNLLHATPGLSDGEIWLDPSGGSGKAENYQISWGFIPAPDGLVATNLAPGTYPVEVIDVAYGCSLSFNLTITEDNCRTIAMQTEVEIVALPDCASSNGIARLSHTGGTAPFSYLWSDASIGTMAENLGEGAHKVTVTDASGCTNVQAFDMQSTDQLVSAQFLYEITTDSILFTDISTGPVEGKQWTFNTPQPILNNKTPLPPAGNYEICLIVENACGRTNQVCQTIGIAPACAAEVMVINLLDDQYTYCVREPVFFSTNVVAENYTWYFGDTNAFTGAAASTSGSTLQSTSHIYFQAANQEVKLVVDYGDGCLDSASIQLAIQSADADFSYTIVDSIATFVADTNEYINSYNWSFVGPNTTANRNGRTIQFVFQEVGEYTVSLLPMGTCNATVTQKIVLAEMANMPENTPRACSDGLDNDGDGLLDCEDTDCICLTCPDNLTLHSQLDVDSFLINYPACTSIEGNVFIQSTGSGVSSLLPLSQLTSIGGNLEIVENPTLQNLSGLENINSIGGDLALDQNPLLSSLQELSKVTSIGGTFAIGDQENLIKLFDPNNKKITHIGGDFLLYGITKLNSLKSLENVTHIGGTIEMANQEILQTLVGLDNLVSIQGSLLLTNNSQLNSVRSLANLTTINGEIVIRDNPLLIRLSGLDDIETQGITKVSLQSSTKLSYCSIKSICDFIAADGLVKIQGNATGCSSKEEIQIGCEEDNSNISPLFVAYPWLLDLVDPFNCTDEKITEYLSDANQIYVFVETATSQMIYNKDGIIWCINSANYNCQSFYTVIEVLRVWDCNAATVIDVDQDGTPATEDPDDTDPCVPDNSVSNCNTTIEVPIFFNDYPWLSELVDVNDCEGTSILVYKSGTYIYVIVETAVSTILYNDMGARYCANGPGLNCLDFYTVTKELHNWTCGKSILLVDMDMDGTPSTEDPDDANPCVPDHTVSNCTNPIIDEDQDGVPATEDPDDTDPCVPTITISKCDTTGGNEPPTFFEDFPWLSDLVNITDCDGISVLVYNSSGYIYILIETPTSTILYNNTGTRYCENGPGLNCLDYYTVSEKLHTWECGEIQTSVDADMDGTPAAADPDDSDPCIPDPTAANCTILVVDADLDGTPANSDPDDTDPCVPDNTNSNCITTGGNEPPAFFEDFPWLADLVNVNDCDGTSLFVYNSGGYVYVLVETVSSTVLYNNTGARYCGNGPGLNCLDYYTVTEELHAWECGATSTPIDADMDGTPANSDPDDTNPCVPDNSVTNCNTIVDMDQDGTPASDDPDDTDPCTPDVTVGACDSLIVVERPTIFIDYPWLLDKIDPANCQGDSIVVYRSFGYVYLMIYTESKNVLYNAQGAQYCISTPTYVCTDFYQIDEIIDTWNCSTTTPSTPYVPTGDCNNFIGNVRRINCSDGTPFIFIELPNGTIYDPYFPEGMVFDFEDGATINFDFVWADFWSPCNFVQGTIELTCVSASTDCICPDIDLPVCGADGNTYKNDCEAACAGVEVLQSAACDSNIPNFYGDFPWLADLLNPDTCTDETITVYRSSVYSGYKYIVIESSTRNDLYFQDGALFCQSSPNYDCVSAYALVEVQHQWVCPDANFQSPIANRIASNTASFSKNVAFKNLEEAIDKTIEIPSKEIEKAIQIFPNPSQGLTHIRLPSGTNADEIQVLDLTGKIVTQISVPTTTQELLIPFDLSSVLPGLYMVQIQQSDRIITKRIVVE